jgi:hypothetical protein
VDQCVPADLLQGHDGVVRVPLLADPAANTGANRRIGLKNLFEASDLLRERSGDFLTGRGSDP